VKITNKLNLPDPIVQAVKNDLYSQDGDISVTGLIQPPRIWQLTKRHSDHIQEDVADRIWALLGSNVHYILERVNSRNALQEERLSAEVEGWKVIGQADLYQDGTVTDWKITSVWAVMNGVKPEWTAQLNCYGFLMEYTGFSVSRLQVIAILRDWSKFGGQRSHSYPDKQVVQMPVPLWSYEKAKKYLRERVNLHQKAEALPDEALPLCTSKERWERPTTYAVKVKGQKRAKRVLNTMEEATKWVQEHIGKYKGKSLEIDTRPGESVRCLHYCSCNMFCDYYKALTKGGK